MSDIVEKRLASLDDLQKMAEAMGPLFGKSPRDMLALMLLAQAEGKHPAIAAQEYDIIQGKPAINSRSAQARFQSSGGSIQWITRSDTECTVIFSHPQSGDVTITWTMDRATKAGLTGKQTWKQYPAQMLAARCISEGVRACYPACLSGLYTVEEVQDIPDMRNVGSSKIESEGAGHRKELIAYIDNARSQIPDAQLTVIKTMLREAKDDSQKLNEVRAEVDRIISSPPMTKTDIDEIANAIFEQEEQQLEIFG